MINIEENKARFLALLDTIKDRVDDMDAFKKLFTDSDFFTAPLTTQYALSCEGGLCQHTLDVYDSLVDINKGMYDMVTITIVALFHDLGKINYYEKTVSNKKVYSENGSKRDEMGRFDWVAVPSYKVKDFHERFILGSLEQNALFYAQSHVALSTNEITAILNSKGCKGDDNKYEFYDVFNTCPLAVMLYMADLHAMYVKESF